MPIRGVLKDGIWADIPIITKEEFCDFYQILFLKKSDPRPKMDVSYFSTLAGSQIQFFHAPFTRDEIKKVVWDYGSTKALGPDGFSFNFIKQYWDILEEDVVDFVAHFYTHSSIPKGCNASFFNLIPKARYPKNVRDFSPISLIG